MLCVWNGTRLNTISLRFFTIMLFDVDFFVCYFALVFPTDCTLCNNNILKNSDKTGAIETFNPRVLKSLVTSLPLTSCCPLIGCTSCTNMFLLKPLYIYKHQFTLINLNCIDFYIYIRFISELNII